MSPNEPLRYAHSLLGAVGVLKRVEQEALGFKPHLTFAALTVSAAQHPAYASAAITADMQDGVHVVPLHDEVTKLMEFWYAVLLYSTGQEFVAFRVCNRLSGYSGYSDIRKNLSVRIVI